MFSTTLPSPPVSPRPRGVSPGPEPVPIVTRPRKSGTTSVPAQPIFLHKSGNAEAAYEPPLHLSQPAGTCSGFGPAYMMIVPAGFSASGLPMGLQLIGRPQADAEVLRLAHVYEQVAQEVLRVESKV